MYLPIRNFKWYVAERRVLKSSRRLAVDKCNWQSSAAQEPVSTLGGGLYETFLEYINSE